MTDKVGGEKLLYCSFCGKSQHEVRKLIAGPSVFICDECDLCDIIREGETDTGTKARRATFEPARDLRILELYVIGQIEPRRSSRSRSTTTTSA